MFKIKSFKINIDSSIGMEINPTRVDSIQLYDINLLVGKNASGKTTVANLLESFSKIYASTQDGKYVGKYEMEFYDDVEKCTYLYQYNGSIDNIYEELFKDGRQLIKRVNTKAQIFSEVLGKDEEVNPPDSISLLAARRDAKAYPYIEKLINWANGLHYFKFGHIHPFAFSEIDNREFYTAGNDFNSYLGTIDAATKSAVIMEFNTLGYELEQLSFTKRQDNQYVLGIEEKGIKYTITEYEMSQGMFRSLWLLLYVNYLIDKRKASLIIIDDLCEGLDYSRATNLGKLLFSKMLERKVQFIATSNDSFLMNVVDIKYWNIIRRKNGKICSANYMNSKQKFDNFKLTGLSNFDLFTSDFLELEQ